MIEQQQEEQPFIDLQHNSSFGEHNSHGNGIQSSNMDRVLYKDLVDIIPLVQSLIERKANSSFSKRGSMIYTKKPSRESLSRKAADVKGRNAAQSIPVRKIEDLVDKYGSNNQDGDSCSIFSSSEKANEELVVLREQIEDLKRKLVEKDELLKSAEISKNQINDVHAELGRLKKHAAEKDALVNSIQLQLSDTKIKLADKQAALEKTQWEAMASKQKLEKLQNDRNSIQHEFSSFILFLNGLTKNNPTTWAEDYDIAPYHLDHIPYIDDVDDKEMQRMEEARQDYVAALAATQEKQDEESLAAAASARLYLQSFIFR